MCACVDMGCMSAQHTCALSVTRYELIHICAAAKLIKYCESSKSPYTIIFTDSKKYNITNT